tara:strand:+ start:1277 stop:1438 length:162 start_codon:yes stop_codon:yes gene_type:complete
MMFELSLEQRKQLVDYMARRPYAEVFQLMTMLIELKLVKKDKKDEGKDKKNLS